MIKSLTELQNIFVASFDVSGLTVPQEIALQGVLATAIQDGSELKNEQCKGSYRKIADNDIYRLTVRTNMNMVDFIDTVQAVISDAVIDIDNIPIRYETWQENQARSR